jgi:hypothetical protein
MQKTIVASALALLALLGGPAHGQPPLMNPDVAYSATRILEAEGQRLEQRYYQQNMRKNRADSELKGQKSSMIVRMDRNLVWVIAPQQKMYMEMSLQNPKARGVDVPDNDRITDYSYVSSEEVHGVRANKYKVVARDAQGSTVSGYLWISDEDKILVKMDLSEGKQRAVMELKDLNVGAQPDSLFDPPAGYQKLAFGGGAGGMSGMGGLLGGRKKATGAAPAQVPASATTSPDATSSTAENPDPNFAEEVAVDAADEAKRTTKDEVRRKVRDGLNTLFGR